MKLVLTTLNAKYIHTSLALKYLAANAGTAAREVRVKEFSINDLPTKVAAELFKLGADIVGFSCYVWNLRETLEIAATLKKVAPNTLIIVGGPEVSYDPKKILAAYKFIDIVVYGEGEETLKELLAVLSSYQASEACTDSMNSPDKTKLSIILRDVKGITYRDNSCNEIVENGPRPLIKKLDALISPFQKAQLDYTNKIAYIESSRGCPFSCQYCLSSTITGVRYFSLERIKSELQKLISAGVKQVKFVDRTFNCNKERAMEIFRFLELEAKGLDINFHFEVAADLLDEEMISYLGTLPKGLFQFEIGVQSTNSETLALIQRKMDLPKVSEMVRKLRRANNIHLHLDLIAGLPKEPWDSFRNSFNDVYNLKPHKLQLGFLKLLKGSGLREREEEYKYSYLDSPPYEVLENAWISYREVLQLKQLEEVLELYFNSYRFNHSLRYLITNYFVSPFDFYHRFASFWEERGYFELAHSQAGLYEILGEFYEECIKENQSLFKDILKLDYLLQGSMKGLPEYFVESRNKSEEQKEEEQKTRAEFYNFLQNPDLVTEYVPELKDIYFKHLGKNMRVESFAHEVLELFEGGSAKEIAQRKNILVFNYYQRDKIFNQAQVFELPKSLKTDLTP